MPAREEIRLCRRSQVTPALEDVLKTSAHACAGTYQKVSDSGEEREMICYGAGLLVNSFHETEHAPIDMNDMESVAKSLGLETQSTGKTQPQKGMQILAHIDSFYPCPCRAETVERNETDNLKSLFGVEKVHIPTEEQAAGLREFTQNHRSLFVYGAPDSGKSFLAYLCAQVYKGRKQVFKNIQLSEFFRKHSHEITPVNFSGLVIMDDIQENLASEFFQSCLFSAFDLVKKRRLKLVIASNLTPTEFVERYAIDELRKPQFENRVMKMAAVQL